MRLRQPLECKCSSCSKEFVRYRNRGSMSICTPCQNKKRSKDWKAANPDRKREINRKWATLNPERDRLCKAEWSARNRGYETAKVVKYYAKKSKALPSWADTVKIKEIYAGCPDGFHVDHVIPLQGKYVCGLHVEGNLQYLSALENRRKSNNFEGNY